MSPQLDKQLARRQRTMVQTDAEQKNLNTYAMRQY